MVFQQRNGRIDRYGQEEQPDIRYMRIYTENEKIKGDMRILEILIEKEKQALENIGDPTLLLGKFNVEEEEAIVAKVIEKGISEEVFEEEFDNAAEEVDPFELLMQEASDDSLNMDIHEDETMFSDIDYLRDALEYLEKEDNNSVKNLATVEGVEIKVSPELKRRLHALIPEEAMPKTDYIRLSPDKSFCMSEMERSMQNNMSETAWPEAQYLWKLHPIFDWINDKASVLVGRGEATIVSIPQKLNEREMIFIVSGAIPNKKSTPVVDEWFGLKFMNGDFKEEMTMEEVISKTRFGREKIPNRNNILEDERILAQNFIPKVVEVAKNKLKKCYLDYKERIDPFVYEELEKLEKLRNKHKSYQLSLFENERKQDESERRVDKLFNTYIDWVTETLEIEENPYLRVVAVFIGGA